MNVRRILLIVAGVLAGLFLLAVVSVVLIIRSVWFHNQVRDRIVNTVETATGGRAKLDGFRFDWRTMRTEANGFTIRGTEPAGKPPLFHASRIVVHLKIVSL